MTKSGEKKIRSRNRSLQNQKESQEDEDFIGKVIWENEKRRRGTILSKGPAILKGEGKRGIRRENRPHWRGVKREGQKKGGKFTKGLVTLSLSHRRIWGPA